MPGSADTFEVALDAATGRVRELLERLAWRNRNAGEEEDRVTIGSDADLCRSSGWRCPQSRLREAGDDRVIELSAPLDRLTMPREAGDSAARDARGSC